MSQPALRPTASIILMYHALTRAGSPCAGQDPHYSIEASAFEQHLHLLRDRAGAAGSARDWIDDIGTHRALLTFDDGHESNYTVALPLLVECGARADFFVNPGRVGAPGFVSWTQLATMAKAGMSIQSHGWDHRYFTELSAARLREDLLHSRKAIEDHLGQPVTLLAPPGGRMPAHFAAIAHECGYSYVLSSRPGRIGGARPTVLPRMAITAALQRDTLEGWLVGRGVTRARLRYATLGLAKRALGDHGYERVRTRLLGHARSDA